MDVLERLRQDTGRPDHRDEVRVATPSGDGVQVDVVGDARTTGTPQVHAEVDTLALQPFAQHTDGPATEVPHLACDGVVEPDQVLGVLVGHHHQVPRVVGVGVEDDEAVLPAVQDQRLAVVVAGGQDAERTAVDRVLADEVAIAPRRPQSLRGVHPDTRLLSSSARLRRVALAVGSSARLRRVVLTLSHGSSPVPLRG
jgi:hypothetical protein